MIDPEFVIQAVPAFAILWFLANCLYVKTQRASLLIVIFSFSLVVLCPMLLKFHLQSLNSSEAQPPIEQIREAVEEKNYDAAVSLAEFTVSHNLEGAGEAKEVLQDINKIQSNPGNIVWDALGGFATGNAANVSSLGGSIVSDLTIFGDVRDLAKEGWNLVSGQEVDELVAGLSAVGIMASGNIAVDTPISILKSSARFFNKSLKNSVLKLLDLAKSSGSLKPLQPLLRSTHAAYQKVGSGITKVLNKAKDSEELIKALDLISKYGKQAYGVILLGGKKAVEGLNVLSRSVLEKGFEWTGNTMKYFLKYPKFGARLIKISYKAFLLTPEVLLELVFGLLARIDTSSLLCLTLICWLLAVGPRVLLDMKGQFSTSDGTA